MKRIILSAFIAVSTALCCNIVHAEIMRTNSQEEFIHITNSFDNECGIMSIAEYSEGYDTLIAYSKEFIGSYGEETMVISPDGLYYIKYANASAADNALRYYHDMGVAVSPNFTLEAAETTGITVPSNVSWGTSYIKADGFNKKLLAQFGSADNLPEIRVAVIDTGIDYDNPLLKERLIDNLGYNFVNPGSAPNDDHSHGTHVAGIIYFSTLPNVKIIPYKVLRRDGKGDLNHFINAVQRAIKDEADVINMSLGCSVTGVPQETNDAFSAVVKDFYKDVIIVSAAGNDKTDADTFFPGYKPETINISAIRSNGVFDSRYSNYGTSVDFAAPGTGVLSTVLQNKFAPKSGTSMACPYAASAVAALKTLNPSITKTKVMDILKNYAADRGDEGKDNYYGYGVINMAFDFPYYKNYSVKSGTASDDEVLLNISTGTAAHSATITAAAYQDGILYSLSSETIPSDGGTHNLSIPLNSKGCDKIKVFVWNTDADLTPLANTYIIKKGE